jgi:glutamate synthase (NADPH/NADH) small chain
VSEARVRVDRQVMPNQDARQRINNFDEVAIGYDEEQALVEASRCLDCKKPLCVEGCPVDINIPLFIKFIKEKDYAKAVQTIKEKNNLPAICGRVCPQENQCEKRCVLGKKYQPVAIGGLERFVADWEMKHSADTRPVVLPPSGKKVAVIGSGPAGLTAAADLARLGHQVTIFEALHTAGGVLVYGIPEFRLPKTIVEKEINGIRQLGVEIKTNMVIGKIHTVDELLADGFDAVFVGTGAGLPYFMNIPGENLNGVYSANEFFHYIKHYIAPLLSINSTPLARALYPLIKCYKLLMTLFLL